MLSREERDVLNACYRGTSNTVRAWLKDRLKEYDTGNVWAEPQLRVFVKHYKRLGSGMRTLAYLESGQHTQMNLGDEA